MTLHRQLDRPPSWWPGRDRAQGWRSDGRRDPDRGSARQEAARGCSSGRRRSRAPPSQLHRSAMPWCSGRPRCPRARWCGSSTTGCSPSRASWDSWCCGSSTFLAMYGAGRPRDSRARSSHAIARWPPLIGGVSIAIVVPLAVILAYTVWRGAPYLRLHFFTETLAVHRSRGSPPPKAAGSRRSSAPWSRWGSRRSISVPLGILTAVFLNEVGGPPSPARAHLRRRDERRSVDRGGPVHLHRAGRQAQRGFSGFAAALALSILMLPTVTRTAEVVLRLVPGGLREASLALGAPEWRTTWSVVLPTARDRPDHRRDPGDGAGRRRDRAPDRDRVRRTRR